MKIRTKVAGVTFRPNSVLAARYQFNKTGDGSLHLIREPTNQHDPNAVKVVYRLTGNQLGYVRRSLAQQVASHLDSGMKVDACILQFTGGTHDKKNVGINIELDLHGALPTSYSTGFGTCHTCGDPIQEGDFIAKKEHWWSHGECLGIIPPKKYTESRREPSGCASILALAVAAVSSLIWIWR